MIIVTAKGCVRQEEVVVTNAGDDIVEFYGRLHESAVARGLIVEIEDSTGIDLGRFSGDQFVDVGEMLDRFYKIGV